MPSTIQSLLGAFPLLQSAGDWDKTVPHIAFDSRQVGPGSLFVAIKGTAADGHQFIDKAVENGANIIVCQDWPERQHEGVLYLQCASSAAALGHLAAAFHGHPSQALRVVGVTGTNGKTSIATLLYQLFGGLGYKVGLLSTVENRIGQYAVPATHTTPDALSLQALLADMRDAGCELVFMECSSHAIDQERIAGIAFQGAIFSNITHDHLDYHKTFDAYIKAKKKFFDDLPAGAFALSNADDKRGAVMLQNTAARRYYYALKRGADFRAKIVDKHLTGLQLDIDGREYHGRLVGTFGAYNTLAVYAAACLLGENPEEVLRVLSGLQGAEGRFEAIYDAPRRVLGIVDYAHTPDALEKVLEAIASLREGDGPIITVLGCGGDRDKAKRPLMAAIACRFSQRVILTADNPRSERAEDIIADMAAGLSPSEQARTLRIADRREAIRTAHALATAGSIVLIAGKGHEKYQDIGGTKYPFDDKAEWLACLA